MTSHKHKRERSHSRSRSRGDPPQQKASSPPSSPPRHASSRTRRLSRSGTYREPTHDDERFHPYGRRQSRYSNEFEDRSEEGRDSRRQRLSTSGDERDRTRRGRRSDEGWFGGGGSGGAPAYNPELVAQIITALQKNAQAYSGPTTNVPSSPAVSPLKATAEDVIGLVRTPHEEEDDEEDDNWDEVSEEVDDLLDTLQDNMSTLLSKVPDSTTQLQDLVPMFDNLIGVFDGLAIGQQTDIWLRTHRESRDKISQLLKTRHAQALEIQAKAAEEIAKIAPAEEEKRRLVDEARVDFQTMLAAQDAHLVGLSKELDRIELKASKELPSADVINKAARRDAYRTMAEKLGSSP
ncbi:hypothetical protein Q8F55_001690 [Vanrija albida]|uniref:Uncharacterized protein n=1 Tax=Vanrija albida TaxID=181172 RepID=A0ABR3Q8S0_9TREE